MAITNFENGNSYHPVPLALFLHNKYQCERDRTAAGEDRTAVFCKGMTYRDGYLMTDNNVVLL